MRVNRKIQLIATAALPLAFAFGAMAQQMTPSPQDHEQHHPGAIAQETAQPAVPPPDAASTPMGAAPGGMMGGGMMGSGMMGGGAAGSMPMMLQMAKRMAEHVEGRLAFLKAELKITEAQAPVWNAFAEAVRENAKAMKDLHPTGINPAAMTLPEWVDFHEKALTSHLEALRRIKAAIGPLYAALSDEQKKAANELSMGFMM